MNRAILADLFFTGLFLGAAQVALLFHLLAGCGALVILPFLFVLIWITGSIAGLYAPRAKHFGLGALGLGALGFLLVMHLPENMRFSPYANSAVYSTGFAFGIFAGIYLKTYTTKTEEVRRVLLYENNGFVMGYALAAALLFVSTNAIDTIVISLMVLVSVRWWQTSDLKPQSGS